MSNKIGFESALVTGGAGFIGSVLCRELLKNNVQVTVLDDLSTGSLENIQQFRTHQSFNFIEGTVLDSDLVESLVKKSDIVFHLAASVGVRLVVEQPLKTLQTNLRGTETVLEAASKYSTKVMLASTSEVYGKLEKLPFMEEDSLLLGPSSCPRWGYAASKIVDELLALAYFNEKKLPVVIFRLFNTVGVGQKSQYGMVIPRFVKQALQGEPLTVYGEGDHTRCFCDVEDVIPAILKLSHSSQAIGQIFNIGSDEKVSVEELAKKVIQIVSEETGKSCLSKIVHIPFEEAYSKNFDETPHRQPDIKKAKNEIGWSPQISLDQILRKIVRFHLGR